MKDSTAVIFAVLAAVMSVTGVFLAVIGDLWLKILGVVLYLSSFWVIYKIEDLEDDENEQCESYKF